MSQQKTDYQPIDCGSYDLLEVACLHKYTLEIALNDGSKQTGTAITTETRKNDGEYLVIESSGSTEKLRLDKIQWLRPLDLNASFKKLELTRNV